MVSRRRFVALLVLPPIVCLSVLASTGLPARLTDREFWRLVVEASEPDGFFRSDNLLSNELGFQYVVPELSRTARPGQVYLGVGPEQNFTYIVGTKPSMVFIVDVRRGNLRLQLMYKALFELSADRAEFVSRLFGRKRPPGLGAGSSAGEIFTAISTVPASDALWEENRRAIDNQLLKKHGFALSKADIDGITYVYSAFHKYGPALEYSSTSSYGSSLQPAYADLMTATDRAGVARSYLATEENFQFMKNLENRNLVVPLVGNFAGPTAIRTIGRYVREKNAIVSAFYLSNVEQYLRQDGIWESFCANAATLPIDETSTFIRSVRRSGGGAPGFGLASELGNMQRDVQSCRP